MKKLFFTIALGLSIAGFSQATWNVNGSNINNPNSGNVGIGTGASSPSEKLHVNGTLRIDVPAVGGGSGGLRLFQDGSDNILSNLYIANTGNNKAFNFQLNQGGSALNLWTYQGTGWSNKFMFTGDGKLGVGTTNPLGKLQVSDVSDAFLNVYTESNNMARIGVMNASKSYAFGIDASHVGHIWDNVSILNKLLSFQINSTTSKAQVWVGVKTSQAHPTSEFMVDGTIACRQLWVTADGDWADYVFAPGYKLMPLSEVEAFYKKESHLPEIPSEKEIKEGDINVAQMNTLLLKKIEELTIYVVEQNKKITELEKQITSKTK